MQTQDNSSCKFVMKYRFKITNRHSGSQKIEMGVKRRDFDIKSGNLDYKAQIGHKSERIWEAKVTNTYYKIVAPFFIQLCMLQVQKND